MEELSIAGSVNTRTQWPNWALALPWPLEELESRPLPDAIATAFAQQPLELASRFPRGRDRDPGG